MNNDKKSEIKNWMKSRYYPRFEGISRMKNGKNIASQIQYMKYVYKYVNQTGRRCPISKTSKTPTKTPTQEKLTSEIDEVD